MKKTAVFCLLAVLILTGGCAYDHGEAKSDQSEGEHSKPTVVATIFPLADLVRHIGGEEIQAVTLLPAGASPHTFEPTPREMKAVSQASLFVSVGAGLDVWGQQLLNATGAGVAEVVITDGLELLPISAHDHHHDDEGHGKDLAGDPHVWLDPVLVRDEIAPRLADEMSRLWPQWADVFHENLTELQAELARLDEELRGLAVSSAPPKFISFHSAWGYLAHRYGWEQVASVLEYPGQEPSARWLKELTDLAVQEGVKFIIIEPQFNAQPANLLAQEIGGQVLMMDPLGGEGVEGRNSYLAMMRYNMAVIKEAMGL